MDRQLIKLLLTGIEQDCTRLASITDNLSSGIASLQSQLKGHSNDVETPFDPALIAAQHRRQHRPGRPSKIDSDPELRAFILARIDTMTYPALEREVANAFPPDRRIGKSAIHHWWERNMKISPKSDPR